MYMVDIALFGGVFGAIALWFVYSRVTRAIFWEAIRHPFRNSWLMIGKGQVRIVPDANRSKREKRGNSSDGLFTEKNPG